MNNQNNQDFRANNITQKYKVLTEISPDCIKLFDVDKKLIYINPSGLYEHNLLSLEEAIKNHWKISDSVVDEDKSKVEKAINDALKGVVTSIELRHTPDTKREFCLETIAPVKNEAGEVIGIFGVSRDITKLKKIEQEMIRVRDTLEIEVRNRTKDLNDKVAELEKINKSLVGRELKMIELKERLSKYESVEGESKV